MDNNMKTIITTVGVSLTEAMGGGIGLDYVAENWIWLPENLQTNRETAKIHENYVLQKDQIQVKDSPELSSILALIRQQRLRSCKIKIYLICTGSNQVVFAAKLIEHYLISNSCKAELNDCEILDIKLEILPSLTLQTLTDDGNLKGLDDLFETLKRISPKKDCVYNISSGYKVLIPIFTLYAQVKKIPLCYLHEKSDKIIEIAPLPFGIDLPFVELYADLIQSPNLLTELSDDSNATVLGILRTYSIIKKDSIELTLMGKLFQNHISNQFLTGDANFGRLIEYKIHESFLIGDLYNKYPNHDVHKGIYYTWADVSWGHKIDQDLIKNGTASNEIDFILIDKTTKLHSWVEVKSTTKINQGWSQVQENLANYKKSCGKEFLLQKIILITYGFPSQINAIVRDWQKKIHKYPANLEIYGIEIPCDIKNPNAGAVLTNILKRELTIKKLL